MKACLQAYINSTNIIFKNHWKHSQAMALHSKQLTIRACNLGGLKADDLKPLKYSSMVTKGSN